MKMSTLLGLALTVTPFVTNAADEREAPAPAMEEVTVTAKYSDAIATDKTTLTVARPDAIVMKRVSISVPAPDLTLVALIDHEKAAEDEATEATR